MAILTVTIPDSELVELMEAVGDTEATTDEERIAVGSVLATSHVRNILWGYQQGLASRAVPNPMPE